MDVILKQDVEDLGQTGEVVHTAPGYARNYLFPRDLAVAATKGNLKNLEHFMAAAEKKRNAEREEAQALADKVSALDIKIKARAGEQNRLFGSVTGQEIADVINEALGLSIGKKKVKTLGSIKTLGKHKAVITVYPGLTVEKDIDVIAATGKPEIAEPVPSEAKDLKKKSPRNDAKAAKEEAPAEFVESEVVSAEVASSEVASEEVASSPEEQAPRNDEPRDDVDISDEVVEETTKAAEETPEKS